MLENIKPQSKSSRSIGGVNTGQGGIHQVLETEHHRTKAAEVLAGITRDRVAYDKCKKTEHHRTKPAEVLAGITRARGGILKVLEKLVPQNNKQVEVLAGNTGHGDVGQVLKTDHNRTKASEVLARVTRDW